MAKTSGLRRAVQSRVNESKVFPATKPPDKSWAQITSFSPFRCHIRETTSKSTFQGKTSKDRIWKLDGLYLLLFCCAPFSFLALRHYCYFQYNEMKFNFFFRWQQNLIAVMSMDIMYENGVDVSRTKKALDELKIK